MQSAQTFNLDNGLRVIVAEDHAAPIAGLSLWVRAGVCDEPASRRGIAHVVEHMMFRGSENVGPEEHAQRIGRVGGRCNAHTWHDATVFHQVFPSHALDQVVRLEADRFRRIRFTPEHLETERRVILEELRLYENQPMARAMRRLLQLAGGDHPYALDPLGRAVDVGAVSVDDLRAFHTRLYRPANVFCVVVGDVTPEHVRSSLVKHFGDWQPATLPGQADVRPFVLDSGSLAARLPFQLRIVARVHRLGPSADEDLDTLELLAATLAHGRSAPVRDTLVRETRLCVEAGGQTYAFLRGGALAFYGAFLPPGRSGPRLQALRLLSDRIARHGPDPEMLRRQCKRARRDRAADTYNPQKRMMGLGRAELCQGGFECYEQKLERLARVTPEQIRALAQRLFASGNTLELDIRPETIPWVTLPLGIMAALRAKR